MKFLLDENLSYRICVLLKAARHDAVHVNEIGLAGADDNTVINTARAEDRVLISCDHDFVHILFASGDSRPSLLLTREVNNLRSAQLAALLLDA